MVVESSVTEWITAVSTCVAAAGAVFFAVIQNRILNKQNQIVEAQNAIFDKQNGIVTSQTELIRIQVFVQLAQQYDSELMLRKRASLARALLEAPKTMDIDETVLVFFENLAHLVRRGLIEDEMAWNFFSVDMVYFRRALIHFIDHSRIKYNTKDLFIEVEALAKLWMKKEGADWRITDDTLKDFLRSTMKMSEHLD